MIVDTSALLAYFDTDEPDHAAVAEVLTGRRSRSSSRRTSIAETDYLVATRHGVDAELAALAELAGGAWDLPASMRADLAAARELIERYADQSIGVADASIVVLAARYRTPRSSPWTAGISMSCARSPAAGSRSCRVPRD